MNKINKSFESGVQVKFYDGADGNGEVRGYVTTFDGLPDRDGDRIMKGAYEGQSIKLPMLAYHKKDAVIGAITLNADPYGVSSVGEFAKTQQSQDMREYAKMGALSYSIGFTSNDYVKNEHGGFDFNKIDIHEVSLVPIPANPRALITAAKEYEGQAEVEKRYADIEPPAGSYEAVQEDLVEALTEVYSSDGGDCYVSLIATWPTKVAYSVQSYSAGEFDGNWMIDYVWNGEDDVTFGDTVTPIDITQTITVDTDSEEVDQPANNAPMVGATESHEEITEKAISEKPWSDFSESDYTLEQWIKACLIVVGDGSAKSQGKLPILEPNGDLNKNAVHAAAGRIGQLKGVTAEEKKAAAKKLVAAYKKIGEDAPESLTELAKSADEVINKSGKRNSSGDQNALDEAHDLLVQAGANCPGMGKSAGEVVTKDEDEISEADRLGLLADILELELNG